MLREVGAKKLYLAVHRVPAMADSEPVPDGDGTSWYFIGIRQFDGLNVLEAGGIVNNELILVRDTD